MVSHHWMDDKPREILVETLRFQSVLLFVVHLLYHDVPGIQYCTRHGGEVQRVSPSKLFKCCTAVWATTSMSNSSSTSSSSNKIAAATLHGYFCNLSLFWRLPTSRSTKDTIVFCGVAS